MDAAVALLLNLLPLILILALFVVFYWRAVKVQNQRKQMLGEATAQTNELLSLNREILTELRAIKSVLENGRS